MESMVEILYNYTKTQPDLLFMADDSGSEYTYKETWDKIASVAGFLLHHEKVPFGSKIMVECNQDTAFLIVDFACELIGAVFVPIEKHSSYDRKKIIFEETEAVLWVSKTGRELDFVKSISFETLLAVKDGLEKIVFPQSSNIAEILYTTGTTGTSKGIVISNGANVAVAENIKYGVRMKDHNREFIPIPISHSHGIRCCYANLLNGGSIVLTDGLMRTKKVFEMLHKYGITSMDITPSAVSLLIKISKGAFWEYGKRMDYIQIGTASLSEDIKALLAQNLPEVRLYNFYGSTESGRSCVLEFSAIKGKVNCIGKPTINSSIVFTDEKRNIIETSKEHPGLLASCGKMNMSCYWKNDILTKEVMHEGYVYTNDLGYLDEEGYVYVLGRNDDIINCSGIKISPNEIEEIAVKYEGIKDAACVPLEDEVFGQVPKLFISVKNENMFDMRQYIAFLAGHIDRNKVPKQIEIIKEIPRTYNGKIQRVKLTGLQQ